jgi:uncharacterized protein
MKKREIKNAVQELKSILEKAFGEVELIIFGSAARGDYQRYSDIDVVVILSGKVDNSIEERIFDMAYDIELKYSVVLGIIVYAKDFWLSNLAASMPLYQNIKREGITV